MKRYLTSLLEVMRREMRRVAAHPRYLLTATLSIVFAYVFFLTLMQEGQPQKLPIAVVDQDGSYLSRRLCHEIEATQGVKVVAVYGDHSEARRAMQRQEIFAFVEIPQGTYNKVLNFQAPHIGLYANNAYLLSGTLSYKSLMTICNLASGAVQREVLRKKGMGEEQIMGQIMPIELDAHLIGNPMANYQSYLLTTILPGVLGLVVILLTVYTLGLEIREGTANEWLEVAGGNTLVAIMGKITPYALWFTLLQLLGGLFIFGPCHFSLQGSLVTLALCALLFVFAMMGTGIFLFGLIPDLRNAVCLSAFYGILGFSLSGFTFPVSGMSPTFQALSFLFPLRHNFLVYVNEALFGLPFSASYWNLLALLIFMLLPITVHGRLSRLIRQDPTFVTVNPNQQ